MHPIWLSRQAVLGAALALLLLGTAAACAPPPEEDTSLLSGSVTFGTVPVAGARVELRQPDWRSNPQPPSAFAVTDAQGQFTLENPPSGEFVLIGVFPDGEEDEGGWPNVIIEPGQRVTGIEVPLERGLDLLEPASGEVLAETPTLRWNEYSGAGHYRVWVIDAGTTEILEDEITFAPQLEITAKLQPGQTYRWVVNALDSRGMLVASGTREFRLSAAAAP